MSRKTSQIYVSRFSRSTTEDDLQDHFKGCGKIKEISMKNGYAFVVSEKIINYSFFLSNLILGFEIRQ